jgi:hypothetical protein
MNPSTDVVPTGGLNRRDFLRLSMAGTITLGAAGVFADAPSASPFAAGDSTQRSRQPATELYKDLLACWCDGLLKHQIRGVDAPALDGGFLCPACVLIHGRSADAIYPLLHMAGRTGDDKYLKAALLVYEWSENQVSQPNGSWLNDVMINSWQGITVFRTIALAEALRHYGGVLDEETHRRWTERLSKAARFLNSFITIQTGVINYPLTSTYAFALCAHVLGDDRYLHRAHGMAQTAMEYFTPNQLIFGEGHPQTAVTSKGCRPVDLGYNIEESLPALALYSRFTGDTAVRDKVVESLRSHLEFMLPDGAWDNSWGTRNFKWTWWGSRTSDGCHPAFVSLAKYDPRFLEAARRNVQLMADCTRNNLLYGGPDCADQGNFPCIHHTFTHAKSLATVLDLEEGTLEPTGKQELPRDTPYGLRTFPEIATHLASIGAWRATVTDYDFEYVEASRKSDKGGGGHATGGALSLLYHQTLGPVCVASMTKYQVLELANQQPVRGTNQMPLTPRIECAGSPPFTSLNDLDAKTTALHSATRIEMVATGRLLTTVQDAPPTGDIFYRLEYVLQESGVEIHTTVTALAKPAFPIRFVLPIVCRPEESVTRVDAHTVRIAKPGGILTISADAPDGLAAVVTERVFNLVPGFACMPLTAAIEPNSKLILRIEAAAT